MPARGRSAGYRKASPADPEAVRFEAAGLRWLADAEGVGGTRVVRVLEQGTDWLVTEPVATARPTVEAARAFGMSLACTHAAGAGSFGSGPPGWAGAGRIGPVALPLRGRDRDAPGRWGEFYAEDRLAPYLRSAVDTGSLDGAAARLLERLAGRLADGAFDARQPALVAGPVARIHGDLWSGNVLWDGDRGGEAVLIDPAAQGGHAETDLAMLALFGQPLLGDVLEAYQEVSPLAAGWRERVRLHQLHPLLVHAVLFGAGYGEAATRAAAGY